MMHWLVWCTAHAEVVGLSYNAELVGFTCYAEVFGLRAVFSMESLVQCLTHSAISSWQEDDH